MGPYMLMLAYKLHDHYDLEIARKPDFIIMDLDIGIHNICVVLMISYV